MNSEQGGSRHSARFEEQMEIINQGIADYESGKSPDVAIISEPLADRSTLLEEVEKIITPYKITTIKLSEIVKDVNDLSIPQSKGIVIVDNCHFIYRRTIGGFNVLEHFLNLLASSEIMFITTWNLFSWNYLQGVYNIGKYFPIQIMLPKATTGEIKEMILSQYKEDDLKFVDDAQRESQRLVEFFKYPVSVRKKTVNIPFFRINFGNLKYRLSRKKEERKIENIVFERINQASNGNPGVARLIWEQSLDYPTIKPSYVQEPTFDLKLSYDEAFTLYVILSMESLKKEELAKIIGDNLDNIISKLWQQGLIKVEDERYIVKPEALKASINLLRRMRVVW